MRGKNQTVVILSCFELNSQAFILNILLSCFLNLYGEFVLDTKVLAKRIAPELTAQTEPDLRHDRSTNTLIRHYR